eukprot:TRINITY_DN5389_c0_g1_i1.p1 TRINITY_DN5389_c0_g1~~TRINITY_DN5389_c0_g1_i1.p1  ORF type:complete len:203 (-),score=11.14 TRINITY_DN5389_c0_g1_i1:62-670(-)
MSVENQGVAEKKIVLEVEGRQFIEYDASILLRTPKRNFFHGLLSHPCDEYTKDGFRVYKIEQGDSTAFRLILNYLRRREHPARYEYIRQALDLGIVRTLRAEAQYFMLDELVADIDLLLKNHQDVNFACSFVKAVLIGIGIGVGLGFFSRQNSLSFTPTTSILDGLSYAVAAEKVEMVSNFLNTVASSVPVLDVHQVVNLSI